MIIDKALWHVNPAPQRARYNARFAKHKEIHLSRVINPDGVGKERKRLVRASVLALRELLNPEATSEQRRDLAAFLSLSLAEIADTVERTVGPWEKRGYWLKADRFRLDWDWAGQLSPMLRAALEADDWGELALLSAQIGEKLSGEKVPQRHRLGTPWVGAWEKLQAMEQD